MTDKHTNANDAGRRVGEPRLVQVGEPPMVLPRCWLARWICLRNHAKLSISLCCKLIVEFSQYKGAEPVGGVGD